MRQITIIGAGVMGSALTVPLSDNGHRVNLWGTDIDRGIINSIRATGVHPVLNTRIPSGVRTFQVHELAAAVEGSEIILVAISSGALGKIFGMVVPLMGHGQTVMTVSKGMEPDAGGRIVILPEIMESLLLHNQREAVPIVAVGGPSKAVEVALGLLTPVIYASRDIRAARQCREVFRNPRYLVEVSQDIMGVEVCAAVKNVYAVGLGICEGFTNGCGTPHKNAKGGIFNYGVLEMARLVEVMGGKRETAFGLAGAGDLELTGEAGRNRILGEQIGAGVNPDTAMERMISQGQTVEGYPAARHAEILVRQLVEDGRLAPGELPILRALYRILYEQAEPCGTLQGVLDLLTAG